MIEEVCQENAAEAKDNTYQRFRLWLQSSFSNGVPSDDEFTKMAEEDQQTSSTSTNPLDEADQADGQKNNSQLSHECVPSAISAVSTVSY